MDGSLGFVSLSATQTMLFEVLYGVLRSVLGGSRRHGWFCMSRQLGKSTTETLVTRGMDRVPL